MSIHAWHEFPVWERAWTGHGWYLRGAWGAFMSPFHNLDKCDCMRWTADVWKSPNLERTQQKQERFWDVERMLTDKLHLIFAAGGTGCAKLCSTFGSEQTVPGGLQHWNPSRKRRCKNLINFSTNLVLRIGLFGAQLLELNAFESGQKCCVLHKSVRSDSITQSWQRGRLPKRCL